MMNNQPLASPKRRRRRWPFILLLIVVALLAWWWFSRPEEMRLVGKITIDDHFNVYHLDTQGLLLRLDRQAYDRPAPGTITAIGLDSKPRWQVLVPVIQPTRKYSEKDPFTGKVIVEYEITNSMTQRDLGTLALSPDGQTLAIMQEETGRSHIWSWRNGRLLGEAYIPWFNQHEDGQTFRVMVQNTGRVWGYTISCGNICQLWAIDGSHLAFGKYDCRLRTLSNTNYSLYHFLPSPDGTAMIAFVLNPYSMLFSFDYCSVQVRGNAVVVKRQYTARRNGKKFSDTPDWWNSKIVVTGSRQFFGPNGPKQIANPWGTQWTKDSHMIGEILVQEKLSPKHLLRIFPPPPGRPWTLQTDNGLCGYTHDGSTVLLNETLLQHSFPDFISQYFPTRYALYTAPGRLRAVLPVHRLKRGYGELLVKGTHYDIAQPPKLSPDGRHVIVLTRKTDDAQKLTDARTLLVYEWKPLAYNQAGL